jgi:hypothetical protein
MGQNQEYFLFNNQIYTYFRHPYNTTDLNERIIEIPIIQALIDSKLRILEVGNVLSHYFTIHHTVVDLYEEAVGVINEDICTYNPKENFNLVVSISSLEHIGDLERIKKAFENLLKLLFPGGQIWFTVPINQGHFGNSFGEEMDNYIQNIANYIKGHHVLYAMRRVSLSNKWEQVPISNIWDCGYNTLYSNASGIVIGKIFKF